MCSLTSIGFRQEKALFRKLLYTNAGRVLQSNDCELWKHSFLSPLFPRESTKGCLGKTSIVDCGYHRYLGDFINTGSSVGWASGYHPGGHEFDSGRTNTQGLKNNWVESAAFVITSANGQTFKSSRIRTISRRSRLTTLVVNNCGTLKNPHTIRKE